VIFTHGYGSNGDDLIGLGEHWRSLLPHTAFVSPHAPEPCPGAPGGRQWWPVWSMDRRLGVTGAAPALNAFIDAELTRYDLAEERLALVGFSQGTMIALHVAPRRPRRLAGVIGYSGALIPADESEIQSRPPVLLVHGDDDSMVPIAAFEAAKSDLTRLHFPLETHLSRGLGHSIDVPGLAAGGAFLGRVLG
jgi:phospholipase/carboxylesterase